MIKKAELNDGFIKHDCEIIYNNIVNKIDPQIHAAAYTSIQNSGGYAEPEFAGKYIDICVQLSNRYGDAKALENAKLVIDSILKHQRADGYLGPYCSGIETDGFGVWNQTFTILGMLSFYKVTKNQEVLNAMIRGTTYIMEQFISGKHDILDAANDGVEHISILLPLCNLYIETKNKKIEEYINFIVSKIKNSDLNYFNFESILKLRSRKGIESFVILLGMIKYSEIYSDKSVLDAVEKYWQEVNDTQIRNTGNGTVGELWVENGNACNLYGAEVRPNETCVAVGWCELSLALFFKNQEVKYLNAIDKTLYNHILASLSEDGSDFAYYQPNYGKRVLSTNESQYKCCRYRGFTLFTYLNEMLIFEDDDKIIPILYAPCTYKSNCSDVSIETKYPYITSVKLSIKSQKNKKLMLRIPEKCELKNIYVNDKNIKHNIESGYAVVYINANKEYLIELNLSNKIVLETGICNDKYYASFNYGCVLLAAYDIDLSTDLMNSTLEIKPVQPTSNHKLEFISDGSRCGKTYKIKLCEYSAADNYSVWIPYKKEALK